MGRCVQVIGVLVFVVGLVLLIFGAGDNLHEAVRKLVKAALLKPGPEHEPESTEPDVSRGTYVVWNFTNLDASGASADVMTEVVPIEYTVFTNKLTGEIFRSFPNNGESVVTRTVGGRSWYVPEKPDQFMRDVIVQPNVAHFATITIARPFLIPGALSQLQSAEDTNNVTLSTRALTPLISTLEMQTAFHTLFQNSANINEFFDIQIRGDSVDGISKFASAGVLATNQKYVAAMLNTMAASVVTAIAGTNGIPASAKSPFNIITPQILFIESSNKHNCSSYADPGCENRNVLTFQENDSGKLDFRKLGQLISSNGSTSTLLWGAPPDSLVGCSNGHQISPFQMDPGAEVKNFCVWSTEISRKLLLKYSSKDTVHSQIPTRRYVLDPLLMQSFRTNPDNAHFQNWGPDGVMNIGPAAGQAPIWLSLPHMLHGPSDRALGISGYKPDPDKHELWFDVEPNTGFVIAGQFGLQSNLRIEAGMIPLYPKLVKGAYNLFPLFYEKLGGEISGDPADQLAMLIKGLKMTTAVGRVMLFAGIIFCLLGGLIFHLGRKKPTAQQVQSPATAGNPHQVLTQTAQPKMTQQTSAGQPVMMMLQPQNGGQPVMMMAQSQPGFIPVATVLPQYSP